MDTALSHWSASWPVLLGYALVAAAHLSGLAGTLGRGAQAPPGVAGPAVLRRDLRRQAVTFQAGLLTAALAIVSPVGYWAGTYIWVRGVQDLMLAFAAPALIVLGAPWLALRHCWPGHHGGRPGASADADAGGSGEPRARLPRLLPGPLAAAVAFNLIWLGWHVPVLFDAAHANSAARLAEYATYLGAGIAFWLQLIGSRPYRPAAAPLRRAALLVGTVIASTILGMVLVFGSGVLYPVYAGHAHQVMTVLDDQQLAGAVLWMGMLPPMIIAAVALILQWLGDEEAAALSAGLDALLTPRNSSWPSRPGLR
jgi:cytochrome c oxidase assembly factor CtaG